jgi:hypothetical protein
VRATLIEPSSASSIPRQGTIELLRSSYQAQWNRRLLHWSTPGLLRIMVTSIQTESLRSDSKKGYPEAAP